MKNFRIEGAMPRTDLRDMDGRIIAAQLIEIAQFLQAPDPHPAAPAGPPDRPGPVAPSLMVALAEEELRRRRVRSRHLPRDLSGDGAWAMLLDLFICHYRGKRVSTKAACIAADAPERTALRWLDEIERDGLIRRAPCDRDKRVKYVSLTQQGLEVLRAILSAYHGEAA